MPLSFWILVHVDIGLTTYLPFVDNRGHLTDHLSTFHGHSLGCANKDLG